jgi:protein SCO1/2
MSSAAQRFGAKVKWLVVKPLFWIGLVGILFAIPIVRTVAAPAPEPLPVLAEIPDFDFVDQEGQPFGTGSLRGKVWVADFIFTRCPTICPMITERMQVVQKRTKNLGPSFHMVSFSVDPEYDTPEVLRAYARGHKVNRVRWSFVTGPFDELKNHVESGMKIAMGREKPDEPIPSVTHGTHFVLVDTQMKIRGFYDSSDDQKMAQLIRDIGLLLNRGY